MVFFEGRLGARTANLRESLWLRRFRMPEIESHAKILESIDVHLARVSRATLRERKRDRCEIWEESQGDFYFRAARGARLLFRDIVHITRNYSPTKQVDHSFNLPRAAAIPPCAG